VGHCDEGKEARASRIVSGNIAGELMKLVSACLLGCDCAYHGGANTCEALIEKLKGERVIPVCPEQLGGLTTPRDRARIVGGEGEDVLGGSAKVVTCKGVDVTAQYLKGGEETLKLAKLFGADEAILKAFSPSCGCGMIFSEDFSEKKQGDGTTTALLKKHGITVRTEID
jgi:uncharacterized protein YbbK (DUF523 family)